MRIAMNPLAALSPYTPEEAAVVSRQWAQHAHAEISGWPGYAYTPLRSLPRLARELDVEELVYKDESARLGQGSFKSLGGAYAAILHLRESGADPAQTTLCCATDGNHGRSVAYAAQRLGCA